MSFILDALKKSEFERQRQTEPGLMDARIAHRRRPLPVWAVLLGLLLGINIVVLLVLLMRSPNQRSTPADAAHGNPAAAGAATADMARPEGSSHFSPLDPAPVYAPEIPVADTAGASAGAAAPPSARASPPSVAPLRSPALRAGARDSHRPDPLLTEEDTGAAGADDGEVLPSISQISL